MTISNSVLRTIRRTIERTFTDLCTIQRRPSLGTNDIYNEPQYGPFANHLTEQKCQFWWERTGGEERAPQRDIIRRAPRMLLPIGTDVTEGDVVTLVLNQLGETVLDKTANILLITNDGTALDLSLEVVT